MAATILDKTARESLRAMAAEYDRQAAVLEAESKPPAAEPD